MARLHMPDEAAMTPEQRRVCVEAVSGPRGRVPAPMIAWLRNPDLASRGGRLGELLRFGTGLEPSLSELAILVCARHWTSHHEWTAHKREALKAGVEPAIIADIAARCLPNFPNERTKAVYEVSRVLLATGRVSPALYEESVALLGEKGLVELVGILGYYCWVALTLNAFELGLPENVASELDDPNLQGATAK